MSKVNEDVVCITGITGAVGSTLCEMFIEKGYTVYGMMRRSSVFTTERIDHLFDHPNLHLKYGDLTDTLSIIDFINEAKPQYFYNEAAQSHVAVSFKQVESTVEVNATGVFRCLEALRKYSPKTKFIQASTSELMGNTPPPHNEETIFYPRSPYGCAKLAAYWGTVNYRERGLWAANAITYNMAGPKQLETFILKKLTRAACRIKMGLQDKVTLGNLNSRRDFNHYKDACNAMYLMIKADKPKDYVISSGESYSIKELCEIVFSKLDMDYNDYIEISDNYKRPTEVDHLLGDSSKIRNELGWEPKYTFDMLVDEMIEYDLNIAKTERMILESK